VRIEEIAIERSRHKRMVLLVCLIAFLFVTDFGLGLFFLRPRHQLLAEIQLMVRFLLPSLVVLTLLYGQRSFFRGFGLFIWVPISIFYLTLLGLYHIGSLIGSRHQFFPDASVKESIDLNWPGGMGYNEVHNKDDLYAISHGDWEYYKSNYVLWHSRNFGPYYTQYVNSIAFPGHLVCEFLPQSGDRVFVKIEK